MTLTKVQGPPPKGSICLDFILSAAGTHRECRHQSRITFRKKMTGLEAFCALVSMMVRAPKFMFIRRTGDDYLREENSVEKERISRGSM